MTRLSDSGTEWSWNGWGSRLVAPGEAFYVRQNGALSIMIVDWELCRSRPRERFCARKDEDTQKAAGHFGCFEKRHHGINICLFKGLPGCGRECRTMSCWRERDSLVTENLNHQTCRAKCRFLWSAPWSARGIWVRRRPKREIQCEYAFHLFWMIHIYRIGPSAGPGSWTGFRGEPGHRRQGSLAGPLMWSILTYFTGRIIIFRLATLY